MPTTARAHRSRGRRAAAAVLAALCIAVVTACGGAVGPTPAPGATASTAPTAPASASGAPPASSGPGPTPPSTPAPRSAASMAWDPTSKSVVLFGGATSNGLAATLDAWDGTTWTRLADAGPPARSDALLVADPDRGVLVMQGGRSGQGTLADTWEWDGSAWREMAAAGPEARVHAVAAFDHAAGSVVLYGGVGAGDHPFEDTWSWDGTSWTKLDDRGIGGQVPTGLAWDPVDKRLVLLAIDLGAATDDGLYPAELWAWSGARWTHVAGGGPTFSPMQSFVEGPRHPWLVDGGAAQGRFATWEWSGKGETWTAVDGPAPSPRNGQSVAFDAIRHEMVLFGGFAGSTDFGDTWLLTDGAWREVR